jgi:hypothetical protein
MPARTALASRKRILRFLKLHSFDFSAQTNQVAQVQSYELLDRCFSNHIPGCGRDSSRLEGSRSQTKELAPFGCQGVIGSSPFNSV